MPEQWIGHALTALTMIGALAGVYVKIAARLTRIETCMEMTDRAAPDRAELRRGEAHRIAQGHVDRHAAECPSREPTGVRTMP